MGAIRSTPTAWFQAWWGITVLLTWLLNISTSADVLMCVISAMIASILICGSFMAKRPIVAWDPESLMVNVGFGHRRFRWADVDSVTVRRVTQRIYFVLPVSSRMELTIIVRGALFGHTASHCAAAAACFGADPATAIRSSQRLRNAIRSPAL